MPEAAYEDTPKSIKYFVKRYLLKNKEYFKKKIVVDAPAGNGITSKILQEIGAIPIPFDLFPEYFQIEKLECKKANIIEGIPVSDNYADAIICQEGIEHFSDQYKVFKEFNRILKTGGKLIITTPNYSSLRSKLSYFLSESEKYSLMSPNEIDSVWMNKKETNTEIYFGHIFLIGIQKLRVLAKLNGFRIRHIEPTVRKMSSLLIFLFAYPFILLSNSISYYRNVRKDKGVDADFQRKVYKEIFKLNINPIILTDGHLFIELEKEKDYNEIIKELQSVHKSFGTT